MGDRRNIIVKDAENAVALYTHWYGSDAPQMLAAALVRSEERWNDYGYFVRAIVCEFIRDDVDGLLGFGIYSACGPARDQAPCENSPGYDLVVDVDARTVNDDSFTNFIRKNGFPDWTARASRW